MPINGREGRIPESHAGVYTLPLGPVIKVSIQKKKDKAIAKDGSPLGYGTSESGTVLFGLLGGGLHLGVRLQWRRCVGSGV